MPDCVERDDAAVRIWEARRVLPRYNVKLAKVANLCQLFGGPFMVLLGGVALVVQAFNSVGSTAVLTGVTTIVSGAIGGLTATEFAKEMWIVTAAMVASVIAMVLDVALIGAAVTGLHKENLRTNIVSSSVQTREALAVCTLVLGTGGVVVTVCSIYFCSVALFYGCCKVSSPVKYMVNYTTEQHQSNDASSDNANEVAMDTIIPQPELTQTDTTENTRY